MSYFNADDQIVYGTAHDAPTDSITYKSNQSAITTKLRKKPKLHHHHHHHHHVAPEQYTHDYKRIISNNQPISAPTASTSQLLHQQQQPFNTRNTQNNIKRTQLSQQLVPATQPPTPHRDDTSYNISPHTTKTQTKTKRGKKSTVIQPKEFVLPRTPANQLKLTQPSTPLIHTKCISSTPPLSRMFDDEMLCIAANIIPTRNTTPIKTKIETVDLNNVSIKNDIVDDTATSTHQSTKSFHTWKQSIDNELQNTYDSIDTHTHDQLLLSGSAERRAKRAKRNKSSFGLTHRLERILSRITSSISIARYSNQHTILPDINELRNGNIDVTEHSTTCNVVKILEYHEHQHLTYMLCMRILPLITNDKSCTTELYIHDIIRKLYNVPVSLLCYIIIEQNNMTNIRLKPNTYLTMTSPIIEYNSMEIYHNLSISAYIVGGVIDTLDYNYVQPYEQYQLQIAHRLQSERSDVQNKQAEDDNEWAQLALQQMLANEENQFINDSTATTNQPVSINNMTTTDIQHSEYYDFTDIEPYMNIGNMSFHCTIKLIILRGRIDEHDFYAQPATIFICDNNNNIAELQIPSLFIDKWSNVLQLNANSTITINCVDTITATDWYQYGQRTAVRTTIDACHIKTQDRVVLLRVNDNSTFTVNNASTESDMSIYQPLSTLLINSTEECKPHRYV